MQPVRRNRMLDMTTGSPARLLLRFSLPLFLGNLLQQFYNLADTSIAGHILGDGALAEIGATAALYGLITNFAFGLNNGLALSVSQNFGAGNSKGVKRAVCWMVCISAMSAVVLTSGFLLFRYQLLAVLQIPEETVTGALCYFTVVLAGFPLTMAYNLESGLLRAVGNSVTPLLFLVFSSGLNVVLDVLFMGPMKMGVQGAAGATVLAQGISAVLGLAYILRNYPELRFSKKEFQAGTNFVLDMFWTGLSMALMSTIYNIGSVILQSSINALGSVYIAAQVGGRRLAEFLYLPGLALGTGIATYSSQNYGAERRGRITEGVKTALLMYGIWWMIAMVLTFLIAPAAVKFITGSRNEEVIANAVMYVQISIPMVPPMAALVILRNTLQGIQRRVAPLLCSALELIGKVIFAFWAVPVWGYLAVCVCEPVTWVICFFFILFAVFLCRSEFQETKAARVGTGLLRREENCCE